MQQWLPTGQCWDTSSHGLLQSQESRRGIGPDQSLPYPRKRDVHADSVSGTQLQGLGNGGFLSRGRPPHPSACRGASIPSIRQVLPGLAQVVAGPCRLHGFVQVVPDALTHRHRARPRSAEHLHWALITMMTRHPTRKSPAPTLGRGRRVPLRVAVVLQNRRHPGRRGPLLAGLPPPLRPGTHLPLREADPGLDHPRNSAPRRRRTAGPGC